MNDNKFINKKENSINSYIPFWTENPNIIFNQKYIFEFFPTENMTYNEKLNAISRLIFILTIGGFIFSRSIRLLAVSFITLLSIFLLFKHHNETLNKHKKGGKEIENFEDRTNKQNEIPFDVLKNKGVLIPGKNEVFDIPQENNPFSNVLMTDYDYNPDKKPAPPSYNDEISNTILEKTKEMVAITNSSQPDITDKLFKDLGDELYFEQSMRQFYTNPNTTIPNDQNGFADFCYGGMVSCKEGNMFACARNLSKYTN